MTISEKYSRFKIARKADVLELKRDLEGNTTVGWILNNLDMVGSFYQTL